ncbi:hypothetical protein RJ639_005393 [Escallonia herrerae]|uniref:Uncharacterized protein n=1 Tax=Escallonia herrerae TaxID=1293975 RepID=A0AA89AXY7_9ASTE|nr:hypothetical protein RJ639_005393 [Escallonia herrerae]
MDELGVVLGMDFMENLSATLNPCCWVMMMVGKEGQPKWMIPLVSKDGAMLRDRAVVKVHEVTIKRALEQLLKNKQRDLVLEQHQVMYDVKVKKNVAEYGVIGELLLLELVEKFEQKAAIKNQHLSKLDVIITKSVLVTLVKRANGHGTSSRSLSGTSKIQGAGGWTDRLAASFIFSASSLIIFPTDFNSFSAAASSLIIFPMDFNSFSAAASCIFPMDFNSFSVAASSIFSMDFNSFSAAASSLTIFPMDFNSFLAAASSLITKPSSSRTIAWLELGTCVVSAAIAKPFAGYEVPTEVWRTERERFSVYLDFKRDSRHVFIPSK